MNRARFALYVLRRPVWAVALAVALAGCADSKPTGTVKGKVQFNNQPYNSAQITLIDLKTGQAGSADLQSDGTFALAQPLPVGSYNVFFTPKLGEPEDPAAPPKPIVMDQTLPEKYQSESTTDITVEVKEGENDFPVNLTP